MNVDFADDDLLPISALQHLVFCERQCMLIHLEGAWAENSQTAQGRLLHDRTHTETTSSQAGRLVARGLRLSSKRLGLSGMADVVEFIPTTDQASGVTVSGHEGLWIPFPVEYKRGRPKKHNADEVQLCAQALCLEEMLTASIPAGALFYGKVRRRQNVVLDAGLRHQTEQLAQRLHEFINDGIMPRPTPGPKCKLCSLRSQCLPEMPVSARAYIERTIKQVIISEAWGT